MSEFIEHLYGIKEKWTEQELSFIWVIISQNRQKHLFSYKALQLIPYWKSTPLLKLFHYICSWTVVSNLKGQLIWKYFAKNSWSCNSLFFTATFFPKKTEDRRIPESKYLMFRTNVKQTSLTHFRPSSLFISPENTRKPLGFLMLTRGGMKRKQWLEMGQCIPKMFYQSFFFIWTRSWFLIILSCFQWYLIRLF